MTWRDNLRPASFRGAPFHFEDLGGEFGRRVKRHDYPGRDEPYHEDLGAETDGFDITAYVLEPDHMAKAQRLKDELLKPGPGTLVHPYWGEVKAVLVSARERITTREGGMVRFQLRFERSGPNRNPRTRIDTSSLLDTRASAVEAQAVSDFATVFNVDGVPGWVAETGATDLTSILGQVDATSGPSLRSAAEVAEFAFEIADMTAKASTLVRDPAELASRVVDVVGRSTGLDAPLDLAGSAFELGTIATTTPSRLLQSNNRKALVGLVNRVSMAGAVRNLGTATFSTSADAYASRDTFVARADNLTLDAGDDMVRSLTDAMAAVTRHAAAVAPALPQVLSIRPTMTRPTLAHAYDLYGDDVEAVIDRADQIAARNRLRHPGFVPAAERMEVLGNA